MADANKSHRLSDFLRPSQVIYELKSKEKVRAIEELLDGLAKEKLIKNKKLILTRLIDREQLESTAIGDQVALPHARVNAGGEIAIAVGRSQKGIDFNSIDKKKVHLIILVVWNPKLPGLFNHLFAGLARFLRQPEYRKRLFGAADKNDLYKTLSEIELTMPRDDRIISRASLLAKLQEIEIRKKNASKDQLRELGKHAELIREELDEALLARFDKLMERYGFAVAEVREGACQGCNMRIATQISHAIEDSNDIYVCENCGKYLVSARKKKK